MLLVVNKSEGAVIRTFRAGLGTPVAKYDFIPDSGYGGGVYLQDGVLIARPSIPALPGLLVIGTYGPWVIVEEDYIPAGYVVASVTGGEDNIGNLVGIREHVNTNLRGLRLVKGRAPDYPLVDSFYQHGFGTGIRHRGAGVIMQITASGTYAAPSAYA
jgi:hypothetical protein